MSVLDPFNLAGTPLSPGVTLIEASAGTGKTFTLAGIVLRLVIEQHIPISEILAVTYTVAATEELRDRVRKRFRAALDDLRRGESGDSVVANFLENGDVARGIAELNLAIECFDEAQILTIHGFCQRVLRDRAFESGALFDTELLPDAKALFDEVAQDFWRRNFYEGSALIPHLALAWKKSPDELASLIGRLSNHPGLVILPGHDDDFAKFRCDLEAKFSAICAEWKSCAGEVAEILRADPFLSRAKNKFHPDEVAKIIETLSLLCTDIGAAPAESLLVLDRVRASAIKAAALKKGTPCGHRFFDLCEEFCEITSRFFHQLTHEFMEFARREVPLRKARANVMTYDDLLTRLRDALAGKQGDALAAALGAQYRAALIDEFQDTDPLQYEIFRRVFGGARHHLFFIGDPKQAIYGFRGADVFTYLRASRAESRRFTLGINWRSEKRLLDAINAFFSSDAPPFVLPQIEYRKVATPEKPRPEFKELAGENSGAPMRFRFLSASAEKPGGWNQADGEELISNAVVADIARLHASGARLGERRLQFSDMAVLVRSNRQAANLQTLLRARGIKSVLRSEESVFHTAEARELQRLLDAVLEPGREALLKSAMATGFIGTDAAGILALDASEHTWQEWLERFLAWRELWNRSGFVAMFRHALVERSVRERLVQWPGGERRLTNFLHLAELLHQAESERRLAPDALCAWLRGRRLDERAASDEQQLRLESDGDAVLIATVHKSKGLEYPVVFCPFLWKPSERKKGNNEVLFHDRSDADAPLTLDLRDDAPVAHANAAREERLAESLRLLYVAITRAQNRCYVYAGEISGADESPIAHLVGGEAALPAFERLAEKSGGAISITQIDLEKDATVRAVAVEPDSTESLAARLFRGTISNVAMISSFTGLISGRAEEEPDRDAVEIVEPGAETGRAEFPLAGFERGVRAGLFFHEVLEHLDFRNPGDIRKIVARQLDAHGMSGSPFRDALSAQLERVLGVELESGVSLGRIATTERLNEAEFAYPIKLQNAAALREVFSKHGGTGLPQEFPASLGRLNFRPVEGFMRGYIDLLFRARGRYYIVDWKSNWLGDNPADYDEAGVCACMVRHCYPLQYHLYAVATDLFLENRVPGYDYEKHFGGVFYIFLRGVDPKKPQRAIFRDRPDAALVRALRETLTGEAP